MAGPSAAPPRIIGRVLGTLTLPVIVFKNHELVQVSSHFHFQGIPFILVTLI